MAGYTKSKEDYLKHLRRIEGQVRGISRMTEEDAYCIDILIQIFAATKALQAVGLGLLEGYISHCVLHAAQAGDEEGTAKIRGASDAIARLVRSWTPRSAPRRTTRFPIRSTHLPHASPKE